MSSSIPPQDPAPTGAPAFRLAFREEGEFLNCYFAPPDTMAEATLIGSLRLSIVRKGFFEPFKDLMRDVMLRAVLESGVAEGMTMGDPQPAPAHEIQNKGKGKPS